MYGAPAMRIAILAGLFGSRRALTAVLDRARAEGAEHVFALGELGGPAGTSRLLEALALERVTAVRAPLVDPTERAAAELAQLPDHRRLDLGGASVLLLGRPELEAGARARLGASPGEVLIAAPTPGAAYLLEEGSGGASAGRRCFAGIPFAGRPPAGDPRAVFALFDLDEEGVLEHRFIAVPWALGREVRRTERRMRRGRIPPEAGVPHLGALLGRPPLCPAAPLSPEDAGTELLAKLLGGRAHLVYAGALAPWPEDGVEHVHDLRVATRRLREALALGARVLDREEAKRADRRARALGRALGACRTFDVLTEELERHVERWDVASRAEVAPLRAELRLRRAWALRELDRTFPPDRFLRDGLRLIDLLMRPRDEHTPLGALAGGHLQQHLEEVRPMLPIIEVPGVHERHHELRIALKHLRYAAEILTEPFPALIVPSETTVVLKKLQDVLGELNDLVELAAITREVRAQRGAGAPVFARLIAELDGRVDDRWESARIGIRERASGVLASLERATEHLRRARLPGRSPVEAR